MHRQILPESRRAAEKGNSNNSVSRYLCTVALRVLALTISTVLLTPNLTASVNLNLYICKFGHFPVLGKVWFWCQIKAINLTLKFDNTPYRRIKSLITTHNFADSTRNLQPASSWQVNVSAMCCSHSGCCFIPDSTVTFAELTARDNEWKLPPTVKPLDSSHQWQQAKKYQTLFPHAPAVVACLQVFVVLCFLLFSF